VRVLVWGKSSYRDLERLPRNVSARIIDKMEEYCATGLGDVRHMAGRGGQWRLRDGDYRVVFELTHTEIVVKRVAHRREVYRDQ
jgi:mRNA interferase RelE/StbE